MHIFTITGQTKTQEYRVTRPIGALLFNVDQPIEDFTNETVTIFIERANGSNEEIATKIPLIDAFLCSGMDETVIHTSSTQTVAMVDIAKDGAVSLGENESVKVQLDGLKATKTYTLNGMEFPEAAQSLVRYDKKVVLSGETVRDYKVRDYEQLVIKGFSDVELITCEFENGQTVRYLPEEIRAISFDVDPIIGIGTDKTTVGLANYMTFPVSGIDSIEIRTGGSEKVSITLRDENAIY